MGGDGVEGWGEKAYNCNCITINIKKKEEEWEAVGRERQAGGAHAGLQWREQGSRAAP